MKKVINKPNSIGAKIKRIQAAFKNRDESTSMLYNTEAQRKRKYEKIVLWGLFASDQSTMLLRPHLFTTVDARTPRQWYNFFKKNYGEILRETILPGMEDRTGKQWRLYRIIGWTPNDNTRLADTPTHKKRNKTKP